LQLVVLIPPPVNKEEQAPTRGYFPLHSMKSIWDWRLTHLHWCLTDQFTLKRWLAQGTNLEVSPLWPSPPEPVTQLPFVTTGENDALLECDPLTCFTCLPLDEVLWPAV